MQRSDNAHFFDDLALAALGEPLGTEDAAHLAGCPDCAAEVRSLRRSIDVLAVPEFAAPGAPVAPPPSVWTAIAAAGPEPAAAQLDPLGDNHASGVAEVVERPDGSRVLRLQLDADAPKEG